MNAQIILAYYITIVSSISHAMEHEYLKPQEKKHKNYNCLKTDDFALVPLINNIQDIPRLSLKEIHSHFYNLSEVKQQEVLSLKNLYGKPVEQSLIFNFAIIKEKEVTFKILKLMFDDDKKSIELFYNTPLWYAQSRYYRAKEMLQKTPLTKHSIAVLFRLLNHQQKEVIDIARPTLMSQLTNDIVIGINEEQEATIKSYDPEIQKAFFADEDIRIITNCISKKIINYIVVPTGVGGGVGGLGGMFLYLGISISYHYADATYLLYVPSIVGACIGGIGGAIYHTYITEQDAPKIVI